MIVDISDERIVSWVLEGKVFIYPTDTVYGLGCDATNESAVQRIREIKGSTKPFSVVAPSKQWIRKYCRYGKELEKLPGPYTFLYTSTAQVACNNHSGILGIRLPAHPFTAYIAQAGVPFVTTSVNRTGERPIQQIQDVPQEILQKVDIIVNVGPIRGKPSTIIDYSQDEAKTVRL